MNNFPDCIVPVGGRSSRMNRWKPGLPWLGRTVIEKVVSEASAAGCRVIVSGGFNFNRLEKVLEHLHNVILVKAEHWYRGMDVTIRSALDEIKTDRFFVVPGDMPLIKSEDYSRLAGFDDKTVVRPSYEGKPGHPVLFDKKIVDDLKNAEDGVPLRVIIRKYDTLAIPWSHEGVIKDIDTPFEYDAVKT